MVVTQRPAPGGKTTIVPEIEQTVSPYLLLPSGMIGDEQHIGSRVNLG